MLDVSIATRKAHAAKLEFDNASCGPAGVERTRREPVAFTDRQRRILDQFAALVLPWQRRRAFLAAVEVRLSGPVGDAAVHTACINAALDGFLSIEMLAEQGLVGINSRGFVRPQHNERLRSTWQSNAITGAGRGR
jgi:hypothetical protein